MSAAPLPSLSDLAQARDDLLPLSLYFGLRGRISRRSFWLHGVLALLVLGLVGVALLRIAGVGAQFAEGAVNVVLAWPAAALSAKRWHDIDRSGWFALVTLVPGIGWLVSLIANGLLRGTAGPNRFGPAPLD